MEHSFARQRFMQLIQQPEAQIDLAEAALTIALEESPDLDVAEYLNALDTMGNELRERTGNERYPLRILRSINAYLYDDLGFAGNVDNYYDPRNSLLNEVIDHRLGIPITLALVYLELARRIDFPMVGIGMPGHFLLRPERPDMEIFVDAFHRGEILFVEDCQERLNQIYGSMPLQLTHLQPFGKRLYLGRVLTNLKMTHWQRGQLTAALAAVDRLLLLFPEAPTERRDRGILYFRLQRWEEARRDLEGYIADYPDAADVLRIRELLTEMARI